MAAGEQAKRDNFLKNRPSNSDVYFLMVVDGKRQPEYQGIETNLAPLWFANNSRLIYTVTAGGRRSFVVVDDQEQQIGYLSSESLVNREARKTGIARARIAACKIAKLIPPAPDLSVQSG